MNLKHRILHFLPDFIKKFQINVPIKIVIFNQKNKSIIYSKYKIIPSKTVTLTIYSSGMSKVESFIIFYQSDIWNDSNDDELKGNLAHEFSHMLMRQEFFDIHIDKTFKEGFVAGEIIADSIAISKGYKNELLKNKKYITNHSLLGHNPNTILNYNKIISEGLVIGIPIHSFDYISNRVFSNDYIDSYQKEEKRNNNKN